MPPQEVVRKGARKAIDTLEARRVRRRDDVRATYLPLETDPGSLGRRVTMPTLDLLRPHADALAGVTRHYLEHRFDLLGSGWVVVRQGMSCAGLEGYRFESDGEVRRDPDGTWLRDRVTLTNASESQRIWRLIDVNYVPIDWQLDFKSGWRWSERTWYRDVIYGNVPGVDVKVPWELARMQHLPQLAVAAALAAAGASGFEAPDRYAREFRNEVLDFIATNPPRYGVDWIMTMDVAIRVVNWLVAYDLLRASGAVFDVAFERVFRRSVVEHGIHIAANLEWNDELRGNHYLADLVGLLFVAAYLPRNAQTDAWLALAIQELVAEGGSQFTGDGASFEASTCYHRLSAEMMVHAVALIRGLGSQEAAALRGYGHRQAGQRPALRPPPLPLYPGAHGSTTPLPDWLIARVERMAEFVADITKPSGRVPQIGDNDSGRFLKLIPAVRPRSVAEVRHERSNLDAYRSLPDDEVYWDEDHLDHRELVAAANGLFRRSDFAAFAAERTFVTEFVAGLARGTAVPSYRAGAPSGAAGVLVGSDDVLASLSGWLGALPADRVRRLTIETPPGSISGDLSRHGYPDFGLYVVRSPRLFLAIRCGPIGQNGFGGHAHNDQLAIELTVDGDDWIRDPGTYVYTPLPDRRNAYRSVHAHFVPRVDGHEPGRLDIGPFVLGDESEATCLYWGPLGFAGRLRMPGTRSVVSLVQLTTDGIVVTYGADGCSLAEPRDDGLDWRALLPAIPFSPGYGIVERVGP